jgi:5-formyltetrahydrofolate cyclo-ligase
MGGGYYDRALAFKKTSSKTSSPLLIGLAYELQKVNILEMNSWDIPMDGIISESKTYLS